MPRLLIVLCSTRPVRTGAPLATWAAEAARLDGRFQVEIADLREINLPALDEPNHPRAQAYHHDHTKRWSQIVGAADAFIFVTPEYNHGYPASLKNAIDFLHNEWTFKPAGFVSYGGIAAGTRAVQAIKPVLDCLRMTPVYEGVNVALVHEAIRDGVFQATDAHSAAMTSLLTALAFWSDRNAPLYVR